mgnify:CR=1 FL=1
MFHLVDKNQKLVKWIMIAVIASFVVWGIGGYLGMSGDDGYLAKVGSHKIYSKDLDQAMNQEQQQNNDKMQVLFGLINRQLLLNSFEDNRLTVTKDQLQQEIAKIPAFQTNGQFDLKKYEEFLSQRMISAEQFQEDIKQQILLTEFLDFFKGSYFDSSLFDKNFIVQYNIVEKPFVFENF